MRKALILFCIAVLLAACGSSKSTKIKTKKGKAKTEVLSKKNANKKAKKHSKGKTRMLKKKAEASYYHDKFNGRKTASGEKFSNNKLTAAHRKLEFGTRVIVTNLVNGKSVEVVINDRGPFKKSREIDLSKKAFMEITHDKNAGILNVSIEVIE